MDDRFKPKYTAGYWVRLFSPAAMFVFSGGLLMLQISSVKKTFANMNFPYEGFGPAYQFLVLLLGVSVMLRIVSDIINGHVRKIEINSEGIIFRRLIGKGITTDYQTLVWGDSICKLSKDFCIYLGNIANRDAMREFLEGQLPPDTEMAEDKPEEHKKRYTLWDDLKALLFMVALCVVIMLFFLPWNLYFHITDTTFWYVDGVIAFLLLVRSCFIVRKALRSR